MLRDNTMITQAILGYFRICYCIIRHMCYKIYRYYNKYIQPFAYGNCIGNWR